MPEISEPEILLYLQQAVKAEIGVYVRNGRRRDVRHENTQDAAEDYLAGRLRALASREQEATIDGN